jgi:hypothetical protein
MSGDNYYTKVRDEAGKLVDEIKTGAEKAKHNIQSAINQDPTRGPNYNYGKMVHQMRTAQLVTLAIQAVMLFMDADSVWLYFKFLIPFFFILAESYIIGMRWYYHVDGRGDFGEITSANNSPQVKAQHAIGLFGPLVFAGIVRFIAPMLESSLHAMMFNLCSYLTILLAGICAAIEVYEGTNKLQPEKKE